MVTGKRSNERNLVTPTPVHSCCPFDQELSKQVFYWIRISLHFGSLFVRFVELEMPPPSSFPFDWTQSLHNCRRHRAFPSSPNIISWKIWSELAFPGLALPLSLSLWSIYSLHPLYYSSICLHSTYFRPLLHFIFLPLNGFLCFLRLRKNPFSSIFIYISIFASSVSLITFLIYTRTTNDSRNKQSPKSNKIPSYTSIRMWSDAFVWAICSSTCSIPTPELSSRHCLDHFGFGDSFIHLIYSQSRDLKYISHRSSVWCLSLFFFIIYIVLWRLCGVASHSIRSLLYQPPTNPYAKWTYLGRILDHCSTSEMLIP